VIAVLRHELMTLIREGRFWVAGALLTALMLGSILVGRDNQQAKAQAATRVTQELRTQWESQKDKNPHSAAHFGTFVIKPAGSVSWLDPGIEPYLGSVVFLEAHTRNEFEHRPATDSTTLRHFGYFSPAFLLQTVAPLIIILFCFSAFAADRESGALRLVLATGVEPAVLVAGKVLGSLIGVALLVLPSLLLAFLVLAGGEGAGGEGGASLARLSLLALGYLLYFATFAGVTLAVSAFSPKSQVALATMVLIWITTCFILPRTLSDLAAARHPLPSKAVFSDQIARETLKGLDGHDAQDERRAPLLKATLKRYGVKRIEDLPVNFDAIALQESEEYTSQLYSREFNRISDQLEAQAAVTRQAATLAPYFAIRNWSMAASGTDLAHHRRFSDAVERYRLNLIRTLNTNLIENSRTGDYGYYVEREFWKTIRPFQYDEPELAWALRSTWSQLATLAVWAAASIGLCLVAATRLRP
jgi:ABC-2 type transport system permease protein